MSGKLVEDVQEKVESLLKRKAELEAELLKTEVQIYNLETKYLEETSATGNVIKGWDSFLTTRKQGQVQLKYKIVKPQDRIFSNSSTTALLVQFTLFFGRRL